MCIMTPLLDRLKTQFQERSWWLLHIKLLFQHDNPAPHSSAVDYYYECLFSGLELFERAQQTGGKNTSKNKNELY